jgi:hypothetical protein
LTADANQDGRAHFMPGSVASFIDGFPGKPGGVAVLNYFTYYDASASAGPNRQLPLGGLVADLDATVYGGMDFNLENQDLDYTSGRSLHLDLTVAQHLPLLGGFVGIGANAFDYEGVLF